MTTPTLTALAAASLLSACAMSGGMSMSGSAQTGVPDAVRVPAGHSVVLETLGTGEITYECRTRKDMAGAFEWAFVGPDARLMDRSGKAVGRYYGPPATWESNDGSRITGTQLAIAPGGEGNIPLQLVKANPAMGMGAMQGVSHVQRLATRGGVAPAMACAAGNAGQKSVVKYQADYIFWRVAS